MKSLVHSILILLASLTTAFAQCPIAPERKPFVEEIVGKLVLDLTWVTDNVHDSDRGFALSLFGVDGNPLSQLLLLEECTERKAFEPYIERREDGSFQRTQLFCEAAAIDVIRVGIASDRSSHMLTYPAMRFQGTVLFDPNPSVDWRSVQHADGDFSTNAEIFRHLIFTPTTGPQTDLTHSALLTGRIINGAAVAANAHVVMPAVTNNGLPLIADVRIDQEGNAAGMVEVNGTTIAKIAGTGFELSFTWSADCVAITR